MVEFIIVNGAQLAYELSGPKDAPLMITLHGGRGMGDHRSDYRVYSRLNDSIRVLSFDFRGHGQSSRTKPYTFKQIVDDIEGLRKHFSKPDDKVIICGGSFGGFLAQQYAISYPSKVSYLILRGTAASHHHEEGAIKTLEARISKVPSFSKEMLRDKVFGAYDDDEDFRLVHFAMMPLYREDYDANAGLRSCRDTVYVAESHNDLYSEDEKYFDYVEKLDTIQAKTLVVVGDQDWICPPDNSRLIADRIKNAELWHPICLRNKAEERTSDVMGDIRVSIDRGGTFCDVIATDDDGSNPLIFKLLSEDPSNYPDAPTEAIRRILEKYEGRKIPVGEKLDASRIASCRIGTTVATNALLTQNGEEFAFATTKGFKDVCVIGDQSRPELFNLKIRKASVLHSTVIEIDERITIEHYDLNPYKKDNQNVADDINLVKTPSGEVIRILKKPDEGSVRQHLQGLREQGYTSLAVCFMHAYLFPDHEKVVARIAKDVGFEFVTISSETSPAINFLNRSNSTCSEAYLYPIIRRYIDNFQSGFKNHPRRVEFMCSDGGLKQADRFRGNEALLS
ncbi:hypothetical protein FSARC_13021, partial [Fusarium sarcochroum]